MRALSPGQDPHHCFTLRGTGDDPLLSEAPLRHESPFPLFSPRSVFKGESHMAGEKWLKKGTHTAKVLHFLCQHASAMGNPAHPIKNWGVSVDGGRGGLELEQKI